MTKSYIMSAQSVLFLITRGSHPIEVIGRPSWSSLSVTLPSFKYWNMCLNSASVAILGWSAKWIIVLCVTLDLGRSINRALVAIRCVHPNGLVNVINSRRNRPESYCCALQISRSALASGCASRPSTIDCHLGTQVARYKADAPQIPPIFSSTRPSSVNACCAIDLNCEINCVELGFKCHCRHLRPWLASTKDW